MCRIEETNLTLDTFPVPRKELGVSVQGKFPRGSARHRKPLVRITYFLLQAETIAPNWSRRAGHASCARTIPRVSVEIGALSPLLAGHAGSPANSPRYLLPYTD
jgi:hypothetical protein